jgi:hypothetical protein
MTKMAKVKHSSDGFQIIAEVDDAGNVVVHDSIGHNADVALLTLEDNGNGYYVTTTRYTNGQADHLFNLGYDELEYLWSAYKALRKDRKKKEESK